MNLKPNPKLLHEPVWRSADGLEIRGKDLGDLIVKLTAYRSRNRLPAGDPEQEVYDYLCSRRPDKCRGPKKKGDKPAKPAVALNHRILAWVTGVVERRKALVFVDEAEASRRSAICRDCKAQTEWESRCKGCAVNVKAAASEILAGKPLGDLRGCKHLAEDCRVSVHLNEKLVENEILPDFCWRNSKNGGS